MLAEPRDVAGVSSSSNGASSNGNSVPGVYEVVIISAPEVSRPMIQVSGEEVLLDVLSLRSIEGGSRSCVAPSHLIQSSHSSMPSPSLKALSKALELGLLRPNTALSARRKLMFLEGITVDELMMAGGWLRMELELI